MEKSNYPKSKITNHQNQIFFSFSQKYKRQLKKLEQQKKKEEEKKKREEEEV